MPGRNKKKPVRGTETEGNRLSRVLRKFGSFRDVASTKTKTAYRGGIGAKLDPWD